MVIFLEKNNSVWFSPRFLSYLVSGSWPPEQSQRWVLSSGVGLRAGKT